MRTIARETACRVALSHCSEEVGAWGAGQNISDFREGGTCHRAHILAKGC